MPGCTGAWSGRIARCAYLAHLSQEFSSILDLDELLTKIASTVRALINYDAFSIFLVDPEHNLLRHRFSQRYDERVTVQNIALGKGITGAAVQSRETIRVVRHADRSALYRFSPRYPVRSGGAADLAGPRDRRHGS